MALDTPYEELDALKRQITESHGKPFGDLVFAQKGEVYEEARRLVSEINSAIKQLERERDNIVKNPLTARPNGLGILQAHSSGVEAAVGRYVGAREALQRVEQALGLREPGFWA